MTSHQQSLTLAIKRLFDLMVSGSTLVLLSPLITVVFAGDQAR